MIFIIAKNIMPTLIPFIDMHHENDKMLFWPNFARSHWTDTKSSIISININTDGMQNELST